MSLVPIVYRSTDTGAPVLTGQAGSLAALLDAVLVDGYGSGPSAKAPAGWTRAFSATNKRAFRNNAVTATGTYLRVDDTAAIGNARHAWLRAHATMSDVDTGTDATPSTSELTNGAMWVKSSTANSTARPWMIFANERWMYFHMSPDSAGTGVFSGHPYAPFFAGDLNTLKPGDAFHFLLTGTGLTTYSGTRIDTNGIYYGRSALLNPYDSPRTIRMHLLRAADQVTVSPKAGISTPGDTMIESNQHHGVGTGNNRPGGPNPISGGYTFYRILVLEGADLKRGYLPNVYGPVERLPFTNNVPQTGISGFEVGDELLPWLWSQWWEAPVPTWHEIGMVIYNMTRDEEVP